MKVALVGASRIAACTLPAWRALSDVSIRGFFSRDTQVSTRFSSEHKIDFLGSPDSESVQDFDAVYISSVNAHHFQDVKKFLERGKHVLVEKPFVLRHAEAEACFSLANRNGVHLQEGMMHRSHPELQAFGRAIRDGRIGSLKELDMNLGFILETHGRARRTVAGGGGAAADLGCYLVDFLSWQFGRWDISNLRVDPEWEVDSNGGRLDSTVQISFTMNGNVRVRLWCSISTPSRNIWEARGTQGATTIDRHDPQSWRKFSVDWINEESERVTLPIEGYVTVPSG